MTQTMRSASLDGYVSLARSCGQDPFRLIDKARIPRNCLRSPDLRLSIGAYCRLLEATAKATAGPKMNVPQSTMSPGTSATIRTRSARAMKVA